MQRDELLNQLKSQDLSTVSPAAFLQVGAPVFPDSSALDSLAGFVHVVDAFRAVHLPSYGSPVPRSAKTASVNSDGDLLSLTGNQVATVQAIQLVNAAADPTEVDINLNGIKVGRFLAEGSSTSSVSLSFPLVVDSAGPLSVSNSSASITATCTYFLTSQ